MPTRPTGVTDNPNASGITDVDVVEHPALDIVTTLTADPTTGTSFAVASRSLFPQSGQFKVWVEGEVAYVTAGHGTGAGSWTVTRGQDGTSNVAHAIGTPVYMMVGAQRVEPVDASRVILYKGRANSFRSIGRAGTSGRKILSIYNTHASKKVRVEKMFIDAAMTAVIAVTVVPPIPRIYKVTVAPTNGTALTKVSQDSALGSSDAAVTVLGDASADGTNSGTALTATLPSGAFYTQEFGPRLITAAGYEMFDREVFLAEDDEYITLNQNEGCVLHLESTLATQDPTSLSWICGVEWEEYRPS